MMGYDEGLQGTVLGPPLWNLFYADARSSVHSKGYESVFAGDFNAWKGFVATSDVLLGRQKAYEDLRSAQKELHLRGEANQV